jgi:hypothetical protein
VTKLASSPFIEIATHTITHTTGNNSPLSTWTKEIIGSREYTEKLAMVPASEVKF